MNACFLKALPCLIAAVVLAGTVAAVRAESVKVDVALGKPYLLADQKQTQYIKVNLHCYPIEDRERRTPVNVAIVIDKSGSMTGEKIRRAREVALMAIDRLNSDDIVSVVAYDNEVEVLVPATKVSDKSAIRREIQRLEAGGSTALYAGVNKGGAEVRKFCSRNRVNRVILLSDGIANVGPSSTEEIARLGESLIREGISVTTLGIGLDYNEDLLTQLARRSDGNHAFVENATDLARIFDAEFGDVLSVVAQEVTIKIRCGDGVRPIRILGRDGDISGQTVRVFMNQLYGNQEKYVLLEAEVNAVAAGKSRTVADVAVSYADMATKKNETVNRSASVQFTGSERIVEEKIDCAVMASVVEQIGVENNKLAVALRDKGRIEEARAAFRSNAGYLRENASKYNAPALEKQGAINDKAASNLDAPSWKGQRKELFKDQDSRARQQSY